MEVTDFFKLSEKDKCVYFIGDKLEIFIPERYQNAKFFSIDKQIHILGFVTMKINDKYTAGLQIPGIVTIDSADINIATIDGVRFITTELHKGDKFLCSIEILENSSVNYFMWNEFLTYGHMPSFVRYNDAAFLFDNNKKFTGKQLEGDHVIYELVIAHCFRDAKDKNIPYRNTNMSELPAQITLRDITYGASTTHSRIVGSYADVGMINAALNKVEENHDLEDLFRS